MSAPKHTDNASLEPEGHNDTAASEGTGEPGDLTSVSQPSIDGERGVGSHAEGKEVNTSHSGLLPGEYIQWSREMEKANLDSLRYASRHDPLLSHFNKVWGRFPTPGSRGTTEYNQYRRGSVGPNHDDLYIRETYAQLSSQAGPLGFPSSRVAESEGGPGEHTHDESENQSFISQDIREEGRPASSQGEAFQVDCPDAPSAGLLGLSESGHHGVGPSSPLTRETEQGALPAKGPESNAQP